MKNKTQKRKIWVQRSKQLATWAQAIFGIVSMLSLAILAFISLSKDSIEGIKTAITASAGLAGVSVTGYMGNSGLEKYTERKCKMEELLKQESSTGDIEEG